jgi:AraC-like DNA-binding protein
MNGIRRKSGLFHETTVNGPLGRVTLAGFNINSVGVGRDGLRVFGSYALVYLLAGSGFYSDANGFSRTVMAGDAILIFPDLGHRYGPRTGDRWDEVYLVFDGAAFDRLAAAGTLDSRRPVFHLGETTQWLPRILDVAAPGLSTLPGQQLQRVSRLLSLLGSAIHDAAIDTPDPWLRRAMQLLREIEPSRKPLNLIEISESMGTPYTAFRKRFSRLTGTPPARWRSTAVIERAKVMLRDRKRTLARIAQELGFADEFHLSRRFKQIAGITPKEYRRLLLSGM